MTTDHKRRNLIKLGGLALASTAFPSFANHDKTRPILTPVPEPISSKEFESRVAKAQSLMAELNTNALILEPGASMRYFSGIDWWLSERLTAVVIPREGIPFVVTPLMEEDNIHQGIKIKATIHTWFEHESPFKLLTQLLKDKKLNSGTVAFEETVRYFVLEGVMSQLSGVKHISGDAVTRRCRRIKSANELKLLHKSNEITLTAYNRVYEEIAKGMTGADLKAMMHSIQTKLGGKNTWSLALIDAASALPHGTDETAQIKAGSTILMDCGCTYEGYHSDISRTFFMGSPSKKQVETWNIVRKGQYVVLENAQIGNPAAVIDDRVRAFYESKGFGPDYRTPGLTHRVGHGIGMDIHEEVYLVRGEQTKLQSGMCFSNEPGIYIPGEFGVRLEEIMYLTNSGPKWFTTPPESIESPLGTVAPLSLDL